MAAVVVLVAGNLVAGDVRVLLVDDDALVRAGLAMMLGAFDGIEVAGAVADGAEVAAAVRTHRPHVVLMDIRMPGVDGLTATEAMRAGASGFLLKHTPPDEIARAVRRVAAGEPMLSPEVLRRLMRQVASANPGRDSARRALDKLSPGERDVALLVAQGRTNQEIGTALRMSTATVKAYVSRILTKLELTNRVQVALLAHDAGS
jgi:DNA-binding NarL/FixJ family response regulator